MSLLKAMLIGTILTFVVSTAIHAGKSSGGYLNIAMVELKGHEFAWSLPLFVVASAVVWGILLLMR